MAEVTLANPLHLCGALKFTISSTIGSELWEKCGLYERRL